MFRPDPGADFPFNFIDPNVEPQFSFPDEGLGWAIVFALAAAYGGIERRCPTGVRLL